jgi:amino acid adenylation domain-containing protein
MSSTPSLSPAKQALLAKLRRGASTTTETTPTIPRAPRGQPLPLSFAQQRLWFLSQIEPTSSFYNLPVALRLPAGFVDPGMIERTLDAIVRRHEILRTTFTTLGGEPRQVIGDPYRVHLAVVDLGGEAGERREEEARRLALEEARRPFDLGTGPLFRAMLVRLSHDDHLLVLNFHNIVFDGWSLGVFGKELGAIYAAMQSDRPPALPALPVQYADFALWQRRELEGPRLDELLAYWKQALAGAPPALELPTDHPRPGLKRFDGAKETFVIPRAVLEGVKALARKANASLYMTLLAAFQVLLHRYTRQDDVCVGVPVASRPPDAHQLIGFFVNMVPVRGDLSGDPSFRELLARVKKVALGAYANQDLPFDKLVEAVATGRDTSRTPVVQVALVLENASLHSSGFEQPIPNELVEELPTGTSKFDLTAFLWESQDGLAGAVEYDTHLFERDTIVRMVGHFQTVLEAAAADPGQRLSEIPLLTAAERERAVVAWNATSAPYPADACFHQLVEAQAARTPDAVALRHGDRAVSYRELDDRADALARHLRGLGVGPEVLVGLCVERSIEMIVAVLGILKAGGAWVPLDPRYPRERLAFMLDDARVPVLLTQEHLVAALPAHGAQVIRLDADWDTIASASDAPAPPVTPDNLAYVIYTSGSTGRPKGVLLQHRGLSNLVAAQRLAFPGEFGERVLQFSSFSFDASVWEIALALPNGGTLVLADQEDLLPGPPLTRLLRERAITTLTAPPTVLATLPLEQLPTLRIVVAAGERCPGECVPRPAPGRHFFNAYGPTESTVCSTIFECAGPGADSPSIGRPLANLEAYVLDASGEPAPVGVPGELHIGGVGLARGYLNRPDLTAARFVAHPFRADPPARLYRSGDLARYRADGTIEFLGRLDDQVKLRGFRIEPGEIEAVLGQHPAVREAIVVVRGDRSGDPRLVAYVVPQPGRANEDASDLRGHCERTLPGHMVPAAYVLLDRLPVTPNGKVDRAALPDPSAAVAQSHAPYVPPGTPTEEKLVAIWTELLTVPRVGIHDSFFDLGGHSLLSVPLAMAVRDALGVEAPVSLVFEAPSVAEYARALAAGDAPVAIEVVPGGGDAPAAEPRGWSDIVVGGEA